MPTLEEIQSSLTRKEAAAILGVSVQTIDHHRRCGRLDCLRIGGSPRFTRKQLEAFASGQKPQPKRQRRGRK